MLHKVKGKPKMAKKYAEVERYNDDKNDQSGYAFSISEVDLSGASFIKLKHKKVFYETNAFLIVIRRQLSAP